MKRDTRLAHAGRHPELHNGAVNPPTYHVSTTVNRTVAEMRAKEVRPFDGLVYGRYGTPTSQAFEEAMCAIEGGYRTISAGSGLAAITTTLASNTLPASVVTRNNGSPIFSSVSIISPR